MARDLRPLTKRVRRIGDKLYLQEERPFSSKAVVRKRNYPPGVHGPKGYPRLTTYGLQLKEKQKAKLVYGILERQLQRYFREAFRHHGNTAEYLYQQLEMRLDSVVFLLAFVKTRPQARQLVSHGHFLVNGKKVNLPSYRLKKGDIVSFREKSKNSELFKYLPQELEKFQPPEWLSLDKEKLEGKVIALPALSTRQLINWQGIVEFYSR